MCGVFMDEGEFGIDNIEVLIDTFEPYFVEIASQLSFISTVWIPGILFFVIAWVCLKYFWGRG